MTKANPPAAGNHRVRSFPSPRRPPQAEPLTEPSHLVYRIARACQKLDVSRSTVYRLVKDKKLVLVKIGKRASGITSASMNRYIQQLEAPSDG